MLVTHDMLEKSTPVCIAFNHMPWHYLAVARLDIGGQRKHFIWKTNFKNGLNGTAHSTRRQAKCSGSHSICCTMPGI